MAVDVSGPWDGSAFGRERMGMPNTYESEYRFEYPTKTIARLKGITS